MRHHVRCAQDHQVFGICFPKNRINRLLVLACAGTARDASAFESFHRGGVIEIHEPAFDRAFRIGGDQCVDGFFDLCDAGCAIFFLQRGAIAHNDLVIHAPLPILPQLAVDDLRCRQSKG
jgi:hypothetical protein